MTTAVQLAQSAAPGVSLGFKNRIINGGMTIDQRNAGASVTPTADGYTIDRFSAGMTQASKMTFQQSSTAPTGFSKSLSVTVASAPTVGASDWFGFFQKVEGFNSADLGFGAAGASTVTISFWVRSSVTGVYGGSLMNSAQNRSYPYTYTVNAANTWEQKTVTIAGDTTGTWVGATNGTGLLLIWSLGAGSSFLGTANAWGTTNALGTTGQQNWVTNAGATFYITGVQLEVGTTATSFEFRDYGRELIMCQRYYWKQYSGQLFGQIAFGSVENSSVHYFFVKFPVPMRASPSSVSWSGVGVILAWGAGVTGFSSLSLSGVVGLSTDAAVLAGTPSPTLGSNGNSCILLGNNNSSGYIALSAEL